MFSYWTGVDDVPFLKLHNISTRSESMASSVGFMFSY